jgi:hypothetical protein
MMKGSMLLLMAVGVVACAHTNVYVGPPVCMRNYEYCVESYYGSQYSFCKVHTPCSRQDWQLLCQNDLKRCERGW